MYQEEFKQNLQPCNSIFTTLNQHSKLWQQRIYQWSVFTVQRLLLRVNVFCFTAVQRPLLHFIFSYIYLMCILGSLFWILCCDTVCYCIGQHCVELVQYVHILMQCWEKRFLCFALFSPPGSFLSKQTQILACYNTTCRVCCCCSHCLWQSIHFNS